MTRTARTAVLVALLAGCAPQMSRAPPPEKPKPSPSLADHPDIVACRTSPAACHAAGWRALRGQGDLAGDWAAGAFLMAGCEAGHGPSCADLAALHAAGRGVARDDARACALGLSEACARLGRSGPIVAAVPTAPLPPPAPAPPPAGPNPADAEVYADWAWTLYPELHGPLGLTREALATAPPATAAERALVNLVIARRMPAVQACVPAALERDVKLAGVAAFTVDPAGRPAGLVVRVPAAALYVEEASWSGCARDVVASWSLPLAPSGGRFWLTFPGLGPAHAGGPAPGSPAYATGGYTKPVLRDPSCVQDSLQLPYRHSGFSAANVTVLFAVGPDGEPGWFRVVSSGVPAGVAEAIWKAMRACEWEPGRDPQGNPAAVYVVLPLSFSTRRGE